MTSKNNGWNPRGENTGDPLLVASVLCEGPESKCFWLMGRTASHSDLTPVPSTKAAADKTGMNTCGCVPIRLHVWTLKFDFHVIFTSHKIFFLGFFFFWFFIINHSRMSKSDASWAWPSGGSLRGSALAQQFAADAPQECFIRAIPI